MPARRDENGKCLRGASNSNDRGSAEQRRRRKAWLLATRGDGKTCECYRCHVVLFWSTLEVDRAIPGALGGTYSRDNIRPVCGPCNKITGNAVARMLRDRVRKPTIKRLCRLGLI